MQDSVYFKNSRGQDLVGVLHRGTGRRIVIDCHGFTSYKDEHFHPALCARLAESGISAFRFDFTGNGESEGNLVEGTFAQESDDLRKAIEFLKKKGYRTFGLCGHSMGASVVCEAAGASDVVAVCLLSAGIGYRKMSNAVLARNWWNYHVHGFVNYRKKRVDGSFVEYRLDRAFVEQFRAIDAIGLVRKVRQPKLIVYGSSDFSSSGERNRLIAAAPEPKEVELLPGADHNFSTKNQEEMVVGRVARFFGEKLK